jgi:hypothetical protein
MDGCLDVFVGMPWSHPFSSADNPCLEKLSGTIHLRRFQVVRQFGTLNECRKGVDQFAPERNRALGCQVERF